MNFSLTLYLIKIKLEIVYYKISESRQHFIKTKYEKHLFVKNQYSARNLSDFVEFCKTNTQSKIFEQLIKLFAEVDLMTPVVNDVNSQLLICKYFHLKQKTYWLKSTKGTSEKRLTASSDSFGRDEFFLHHLFYCAKPRFSQKVKLRLSSTR